MYPTSSARQKSFHHLVFFQLVLAKAALRRSRSSVCAFSAHVVMSWFRMFFVVMGTADAFSCWSCASASRSVASWALVQMAWMSLLTADFIECAWVSVPSRSQDDKAGIPASNHMCSYSIDLSNDFRNVSIAASAKARLIGETGSSLLSPCWEVLQDQSMTPLNMRRSCP